MKKKLGLMSLGILAIFLFVSFASATVIVSEIGNLPLTDGSFDVKITSTINDTVSLNIDNIVIDNVDVQFTFPTNLILTENVEETITVNYTVGSSEFEFGEIYSTILDVDGTGSNDASSGLYFTNDNFCEDVYNPKKLDVSIEDITVKEGFGEDDDFWYLLDEIEVEVLVENNFNFDLKKVEVSWELYSTNGKKISSGDLDTFRLKDGRDETVYITFTLNDDIEQFDGEDAILYVKAIGEIDDDSSNPYDGEDTCGYYEGSKGKNIEIRSGDDFVIAGDFKVNNEDVEDVVMINCDETLEISAQITNIGDSDQDDVYVEVSSDALGISERFDFNEIKAFENEQINFEFTVPKDLEEKSYSISFEVYDEENDLFENKEDDKAKTTIGLKGEENCKIEVPTIAAELEGEAKAGKEMIIKVNLRNDDPKSRMFLISASDYRDWASLESITPEYIELGPGENADIEFVLTPNKDLEEKDYSFNIVSSVEGEEILVQAVAVNVKDTFSFGSLGNFDNFDWKLWGIVALNVILLVAIILVTVKIMKKK